MARVQKILPIGQARKIKGYTGTEYYSGYFTEEDNSVWRDEQRIDIVNEMRDGDATVQGILDAVNTPILSAEREITPYSKDPKDIKIRDFVEKNLYNLPMRTFDEFLREVCTMYPFGHSVFEKIWMIDKDGMVVLKDLAPRVQASIQAWILPDKSPGIVQRIRSDFGWEPEDNDAVKTGEFNIPFDKLVIFTNGKEGDDLTGRSILRAAYKHYLMKDGTYRIAAIGIEKTAIGIPTGYLPEGITVGSDEYNKFEEMLENIRANEKQFMLLPNGYKWEFVNSNGGQLGTVVKDFIDHHDLKIMFAVLASFLNLGTGAGSYALEEGQQGFFLQAIEHKAKYIASQITRQIIKDLVDYNFKDVAGYPEYKFTSVGMIDLKEMSEVYTSLVNSGIVNMLDEQERAFARKVFKLPEIDHTEKEQAPDEVSGPTGGEVSPAVAPPPSGAGPDYKTDVEIKDGDDDRGDDQGLSMLEQKKKTTFWRELTEPEKRVDFQYLEKSFDDLEKKLRDGLADIFGQAIEKMKPTIQRIISEKNLAALAGISIIPWGKVRDLLKESIVASYEVGKKSSADELDVTRPTTPLKDTQTLMFDASELANQIKAEMESKVKQTAKDAITKEVAVAAAVSAVITAAVASATQMTGNLSGYTIGENINRGRTAVFNANASDISGYQRTEILDEKTCNMCLSLDSRIVKADDPMAKLGSVHNNCRGEWVALRTSEFDQQAQEIANGVVGIPKTIINQFDTVGGVPVINSFTQLKKVNNRSNEGVQEVIKSKAKE